MTFRSLLGYENLAKKREGRRPWLAIPLAALAALAVWGARTAWGESVAGELRTWWTLGLAAAGALVVMGGPFRLFWRPEATILARLPIAGGTLYALATWRALVAAARPALVLLATAPVLGLDLWPCVVLVGVLGAAVLLAPAASTLGGAILVSDKAQQLVRQAVGGQTAPNVIWLSLLPGGSGLYTAWVAWHGERSELGLLAAIAVVAFVVAARVARATLSAATREVAALDAVKLAHVDLDRARGLERLWGKTAGAGRVIYEKDVALMRRRHIGYYILSGLIVIAMWIATAAAGEPTRARFVAGGALALAAYTALTAWRLWRPPIEYPRLLATLPFAPATVAQAKRMVIVWRALWSIGLAVLPFVIRVLAS